MSRHTKPAKSGYGLPVGRKRKVHYFIPNMQHPEYSGVSLESLCRQHSIYLPTHPTKVGTRKEWAHLELCALCDRLMRYPTHLGARAVHLPKQLGMAQ